MFADPQTAFSAVHDGFPWFINLVVTARCNLSCVMCDSRISKMRTAPALNVLAFIDKLADWLPADRKVILTGGEPLMHPRILDFIRRLAERGLMTSLITNGSLLNPGRVHGLAGAGLARINFSLDGIGEVHDKIRNGPGLFQGEMDMIRYVSENTGIEIYTTSVISAASAESLPELMRILSRNPRIAAMRLQALVPALWRPVSERGVLDEPLWPRDRAQTARVLKTLDELEKLKNEGIPVQAPEHQFELWRKYFADPIHFHEEVVCNIEEISFQMLPDGAILHCDGMGRMGTIDDDPRKLWLDGIDEETRGRIKRCRRACNYKINCCVL